MWCRGWVGWVRQWDELQLGPWVSFKPQLSQVVTGETMAGRWAGRGIALLAPLAFCQAHPAPGCVQDPVPLDQFDAWQQCKMPGVKADLTAVNLTAADKAGAFYLTQQGAGAAGSPSPAPTDDEADSGADAEGPENLPEPGGMATAAAPSPAAEADDAAGLLEQLAPSPAPGAGLEESGLEAGKLPDADLIAAAPAPRRLLRDA